MAFQLPHVHLPHVHLPHGLVAWPRAGIVASVEPWYMAYALLGVVQGGMLPLLLPLSSGGAANAGVVVGAMNLAGLSAPWFGHLADGRRWHREILLAGLLVVAAALAAMPLAGSLPARAALAVLLGLGFAAANTVSNMFIVEVRPREEWGGRIGALQTCSGAGQVAGLLAAGFFGDSLGLAFGVAAALVATAAPIAWRTLRGVSIIHEAAVLTPRQMVAAPPPMGGEGWTGNPSRHFHLPTIAGLRRVVAGLEMPFAQVLLLWFAAFTAITAVLTMFPLAMWEMFAAPRHLVGSTYGFAALAALPLYAAASTAARRWGPRRVMRTGFAIRAVALGGLTASCLAASLGLYPALAAFVVLVMAWPALGVSGTALIAELAPHEKGEALGLFNATSSVAGACGALAGGWAQQAYGYGAVCGVATLVVAAVALALGFFRTPRPEAA